VLVGTQGADRIGGGFEADEIKGGTGNDLIAGGPGSDWIVSTGGNSRIFGGHGDDVIEGGPGNNWIEGGPGDDEIYAGLGRDVVWGGTTAAGYDAFIRPFEQVTGSVANVEPGRPIEAALHAAHAGPGGLGLRARRLLPSRGLSRRAVHDHRADLRRPRRRRHRS
jgi:hypothetical protein